MKLVEDLIAITDRMIEHAQEGCWEEVIEVQDERADMYVKLEQEFSINGINVSAETLSQLKDKNDRLLALSQKVRDESKGSLQQLRSRKKVADAYKVR